MLHQNQKGQVLLIVVLVMVVALTVGLSLATRSITNLRVAVEEQNSEKALSAAEAGVEQALKTGTGIATSKSLGNNSNIVSVDITEIKGLSDILMNNGSVIYQDDGADLWLTTYDPDISKLYQDPWTGSLTFYWGSATDVCSPSSATNTMAALEVFVISGTRGNPKISRHVYDPCGARAAVNGFNGTVKIGDYPLTTSDGIRRFAFKTEDAPNGIIPVSSGLIVRVVPLYAGTVIWAHGGQPVPNQGNPQAFRPQGKIIASKGAAGSAQRKILYYQGYESVPSEFFYALLSK